MREKKEEEYEKKKAGQRKNHINKWTKIYHKETKCKMNIHINSKKLEEKQKNEECRSSEIKTTT